MVTTFKETLNGFYCAECRMAFSEPQATCPYFGSIVTNYESLIVQHEDEEELTEYQKDLLQKLAKAVGELHHSIFEEE